jgi:hypothetical protein
VQAVAELTTDRGYLQVRVAHSGTASKPVKSLDSTAQGHSLAMYLQANTSHCAATTPASKHSPLYCRYTGKQTPRVAGPPSSCPPVAPLLGSGHP